jgi:SHS2 domain-containing protein
MGTYEFKEHTADEKFIVKAESLSDAFATAVKAFYEILLGKNYEVKQTTTREIILKAKKKESLLYDFLNELVFYMDESDLILPKIIKLSINKTELGEYELEAELGGDKRFDYELLTEIKNMTYSEMKIEEKENEIEMTVVVDI